MHSEKHVCLGVHVICCFCNPMLVLEMVTYDCSFCGLKIRNMSAEGNKYIRTMFPFETKLSSNCQSKSVFKTTALYHKDMQAEG